ncbi:MAG: inorganic phosphate transporter [Candidatus Cryosericum sp.]|nr:inorganic phosphate transporter [bacterium]
MTLAYVGFVLAALALQLLMGANDGGTLLGSIVATNIIRPVWAVALLFVAIVVAPLTIGTAVVTTLGNHIVPLSSIRMEMLYGTVAATVLWVWLAKRLRSPVSISYTFVGSLLGSALAAHLGRLIDPISILEILGGMLVAILASFVLGYVVVKMVDAAGSRATPRANSVFKVLQVFSSLGLVLGYGANDAAKTLSLLYIASVVQGKASSQATIAATTMLGTVFIVGTLFLGGGFAQTSGFRLMKSSPKTAFIAQGSTAILTIVSARRGFPVSSTESLNMALVGTGAGERPGSVRWNVVTHLMVAWVVTVPVSVFLSWGITSAILLVFH